MSDLLDYKCPCCGGAITFDSSLQKMKCPYCDNEFDVETLKGFDEALNQDAEDNMQWNNQATEEWTEGEAEGMRVYVCQSCGGEVVGDETLGATTCPYCDNPVVMKGQFSGDLKPNFIIPFKYDKKQAKENLAKHLKGKLLLPKAFKTENHIDEVKGLYVPFWLFDTHADAFIRYRMTRTRHWSDSSYDYTETSHYMATRAGDIAFERVPVDGSEAMPNDLMESIEPFDVADMTDFQTAYMAGYLADRYDVTAEDCTPRANERVKQSTEDAFRDTVVGYDTVVAESSTVNLDNGKINYAMYPVWILNTTWKDEKFLFAMNGQTGKFVGNLPMKVSAFLAWLFGVTVGVGGLAFLVQFLLWKL